MEHKWCILDKMCFCQLGLSCLKKTITDVKPGWYICTAIFELNVTRPQMIFRSEIQKTSEGIQHESCGLFCHFMFYHFLTSTAPPSILLIYCFTNWALYYLLNSMIILGRVFAFKTVLVVCDMDSTRLNITLRFWSMFTWFLQICQSHVAPHSWCFIGIRSVDWESQKNSEHHQVH